MFIENYYYIRKKVKNWVIMLKISLPEIETAYRKLKSYVYYDTTLNFLRRKLAEFECHNIDEELKKLKLHLNNYGDSKAKEYFNRLLNEINYNLLPKKIEKKRRNENFISNDVEQNKYKISKATKFINTPVQLHIISVLWIMKSGYKLAKNFNSNSYGYILETNSSTGEIKNGLRLFKPYFIQYQAWRDNAIKATRSVLDNGNNVAIISLDIKDFYHSVNISFENLKKELNANNCGILTCLLEKIHLIYSGKIKNNKNNILPIGLLSSAVLANWYLQKFDEEVENKLNPIHYGRYVDDILIVISNPKFNSKKSASEEIIEKYFKETNIFENENEDEKTENYKLSLYPNKLYISEEKFKIYHFNADNSDAVLEIFEENIRKNASAFRLLPENYRVDNEFKHQAYSIVYSDSFNKLRSIEEFKENKYKASVYLARKIFASRLWNEDSRDAEKTSQQILKFFKGRVCLEFHTLWERIFTYFVLKNLNKQFVKFYNYILTLIDKVEFEEEIKDSLREYVMIAASMPLSLNINFFNQCSKYEITNSEGKLNFDDYLMMNFRKSNLIRHHYVFYPLLNYTEMRKQKDFNFLQIGYFNFDEKDIKIDDKTIKYSPRFVKLDDVTNYYIFKKLFSRDNNSNSTFFKYLKKVFEQFYTINSEIGYFKINKDELIKEYFEVNDKFKKEIDVIKEQLNYIEDSLKLLE